MRVVIAVVGSFVNESEITESVISGVTSQGLLCDGTHLGWVGAGVAAGSAALLPSTFAPGDSAPSERPRRGGGQAEEPAFAGFDKKDEGPDALFGPVLTKEEKKALAAKKKAEREAKKNGGVVADDAGAGGAAKPRVQPTKADIKRIKKLAADKRKKGEDVVTDDELEAAGFLLEGEEA